VNVKSTQEAL